MIEELRKNKIYTGEIVSYTSECCGVAKINGYAVFVPGTIVGEIWEIIIVKVSASAIYGKAVNPVHLSDNRSVSDCSFYPLCGGCSCRHMNYDEELSFKLSRVNAALSKFSGQSVRCTSIINADSTEDYRNKVIYEVQNRDGKAVFGFYRQRTHDIIPVNSCKLQDDLSIKFAGAVTSFMNEKCIPAYDEATGKGTVRHIYYRQSFSTEDKVGCIVAAKGFGDYTSQFCDYILTKVPELTGLLINVNKSKGNAALTDKFYTLYGSPDIYEVICGVKFRISPKSFFQIYPAQAEKLYKKVLAFASPDKNEDILDLYCGTGSIGLTLASSCHSVTGVEIIPEAIENAKFNAEINAIDNAEFICSDSSSAYNSVKDKHFNTIIVDPPRKGLEKSVIEDIVKLSPEKVVYVSCKPETLARDISIFHENGYILKDVCAADLFPRTHHVETVVLMSRVKE